MIPVRLPNRRERKRAERLAGKQKPAWATKALGILTDSQAIHESAHVIVALMSGFRVHHLTIQNGQPHAKIEIDLGQPAKALVAFHAGAAAVRLLVPQISSDGFGSSDASDAGWVERCLAEMRAMGLPTFDANRNARLAAEKLVRVNEAPIRKLAAALVERKHLDAPAILQVFRGAADGR